MPVSDTNTDVAGAAPARYASLTSAVGYIVDGKKLLSGYRGWTQFQDDFGLMFGATVLGSERGVGTFQSVRFEIDP